MAIQGQSAGHPLLCPPSSVPHVPPTQSSLQSPTQGDSQLGPFMALSASLYWTNPYVSLEKQRLLSGVIPGLPGDGTVLSQKGEMSPDGWICVLA